MYIERVKEEDMSTTITETPFKGTIIFSGFTAYSFWAKSGPVYEGGYRDERKAVNAVKRRLRKLWAKNCRPNTTYSCAD